MNGALEFRLRDKAIDVCVQQCAHADQGRPIQESLALALFRSLTDKASIAASSE